MARKRKPAGKPYQGPYTAADIERALRSLGWYETAGGKHPVYRHDDSQARIPVSREWSSVRCGDAIFNGIAEKTGLGKKGLRELLNELRH